jgi:hypothetical protein|tara:strand:+ start:224 stop:334 length:111 start_codon:yes stop_codon:yes gene_type:complete
VFTGGHNEKVGLYCGKVEAENKALTIKIAKELQSTN